MTTAMLCFVAAAIVGYGIGWTLGFRATWDGRPSRRGTPGEPRDA